MTERSRVIRRRRMPGVDFHSSGGIYRIQFSENPKIDAATGLRMSFDSEETIESRIARWLETGDGQDDVFRAVTKLIEARHRYFSDIYGERVTTEALDDAPGRVFLEIRAGRFTAGRPFRPWLKIVLRNRIFDILRQEKRRAEKFPIHDKAETVRDDADIDRTINVAQDALQADLLVRVVAELEHLLRSDNRLIFAVASGLAEHLDRPVLDRWCAACNCGLPLREVVDELLELPIHGRLSRLAAAFGLKPNTCIKRFHRAAEDLAKSPLLKDLWNTLDGAVPPGA